jgi:hypothetical protein
MEAHEGCHESENIENSLPPPDEPASPPPKTRMNRFFSWSSTHGGWITVVSTVCTAFATIALSFITYYYLMATREYVMEARKQRELMQAQFVSANSPNILIETPREFTHRTEAIMSAEIRIHNSGASVDNAEFLFALLCCEKIKDILGKYREIDFISQSMRVPHIGLNHNFGLVVGIFDQDKMKFQSAFGVEKDILIFAYARLVYTKPALLIGDKPESVTDVSSFGWNPKLGRWYILDNKSHEQLKLFIERKTEEERKANSR